MFSVLGVSAGFLQSGHQGFSVVNTISSYGGGYGDQSGATLTSLARNSAIQAKNAVKNQEGAGGQAEYNAKSSLANVASEVSTIHTLRLIPYMTTFFQSTYDS